MSARKHIWTLALIGAFLAGVLVTRIIYGDKRVHAKNDLTFVIHPAGVYFSPDGRDTLKWIYPGLDPGKKVYIHFIGSSPCTNKTQDTDSCEIRPRAGGTYKYYCTDNPTPGLPPAVNATQLCDDPGIDPNSDTGSSRVARVDDSSRAPQITSKAMNLGAAGAPTKLLVVGCNKKDLVLYYGTSQVPPADYPTVSQNDVIEWDSDIDIGASIAFDTPSDCTGDLSANPATCTMGKPAASPVKYTINGTCGKKPATPLKSQFYFK